ncbi:MAG: methyltransferase domain-containing protein [Actinomycetota bacterium]
MEEISTPSLVPGSPGPRLTEAEVEAIRRSRRHPRRTQFDYLHVRYLARDLAEAIDRVPLPVGDALDVWCGTRPYEDLLPPGARCVGLDVEGNPYGVADVVSNEVLPFPEESFDLVYSVEAFQFVREPRHAVAEFGRVLRPGGTALVAVPYAFEYDRANFERRYTGNELVELFDGWDGVALTENGGRGVAWTVLTASMLEHAVGRARLRRSLRPLVGAAYAALNGIGAALARIEERHAAGTAAFPMNLLITARKPPSG